MQKQVIKFFIIFGNMSFFKPVITFIQNKSIIYNKTLRSSTFMSNSKSYKYIWKLSLDSPEKSTYWMFGFFAACSADVKL